MSALGTVDVIAVADEVAARALTSRLLLTRREAAEAMAMSLDSWERFVQPEIRLIRRGSLRLVALVELQRWIERNAARTLAEDVA